MTTPTNLPHRPDPTASRHAATSPIADLSLTHYEAHVVASGISDQVAMARGYRTVTQSSELIRLGFSQTQAARVPGLLIPLYGWTIGESKPQPTSYHFRPDVPRIRENGKAAKYEYRPATPNVLDVPPRWHVDLANPSIPLIITEGAKKADALASGLHHRVLRPIVGLSLGGVACWRGSADWDAAGVALPEWRHLPFKRKLPDGTIERRLVYLAFDSDVMTKPEVHRQLADLRDFLRGYGAIVKIIYLPAGKDGAKTGLDDFLAAGHTIDDVLHLAKDELLPIGGSRPLLMTVDEILNRPDVPWLVRDLLPKNGIAGLWGMWGSGKSFVALDLACHLAAGREWHGHSVVSGPVVYVCAEGTQGLPQRLRAWLAATSLGADDLGPLRIIPQAQDFASPDVIRRLITEIRTHLADAPPVLVIVDTLARNMASGDENLQEDMGAFLRGCDGIRTEFGCQVLILHHPNKAGEVRGSTVFPATLDTLIGLKKDGDAITLRVEKAKDGPADLVVRLRLRPEGASVVVTTADAATTGTAALTPSQLAALRLIGEEPMQSRDWLAGAEGAKATHQRMVAALLERGFVMRAVGTRAGRFQRTPAGTRYVMEHGGGPEGSRPPRPEF